MSAFAGIFNFADKPIRAAQREQLAVLWQDPESVGPDGGDVMFDGPVGMCYRAFAINDEMQRETQPFVGRDKTMVVGDLRLDNRHELISELRNGFGASDMKLTDIELVLKAYQRWGEMFPAHLVGEFALMLYDPAARKIVLARDHIGTRPLYYHYDNERLICSSAIGPLLQASGIPWEVNNEFVAGYLMYDPEPELTAYKNIHSVKPFHLLTFAGDGRLQEKRYWDLGDIKPLRFASDNEYEEGFRFHFTNAVRATLRTNRPVFSELSGGLDSSSIVCVAHELIQNSDVQAKELLTVSLVSTDSPTSDQTKYIRFVEQHIGRAGYHIDEDDYPLFSTLSVERALPNLNPLLFSEAKHEAMNLLMEHGNARVLLSGVGGDEIACAQQNPYPELADLLASLRLIGLHERLKAWSKGLKRPYLSLMTGTVASLLPHPLQHRRELKTPDIVPGFLSPGFVKEFSLKKRHIARNPFKCDTPSGDDQALGFWTAIRGIAVGYRREIMRADVSYPFLARPLVEYMQAIPHTQRVQLGKSRFLMRRALKGVLTPEITKRRGKGNPQETIARAFMHEWQRLRALLEDGRIGSWGYVDLPAFLSAVDEYKLGKGIYLAMLLKLLSLECWLRRLESGKPAAAQLREPVTDLSYKAAVSFRAT